MTIREYAKRHDHKVIGKLKRMPDESCKIKGEEHVFRIYLDEAENLYQVDWRGNCVCIATFDGAVI